jgi:hypothetical protein
MKLALVVEPAALRECDLKAFLSLRHYCEIEKFKAV